MKSRRGGRPRPKELPQGPTGFGELMAAYRSGLHRDLTALADAHPNVRVHEIDTDHGMVFGLPDTVAALVLDHLREHAPTGG